MNTRYANGVISGGRYEMNTILPTLGGKKLNQCETCDNSYHHIKNFKKNLGSHEEEFKLFV
jgi:hypothetical protein